MLEYHPSIQEKDIIKAKKKGQLSCNPKGKNPSDLWAFVKQEWENEIWDIPNVKANHVEKTIHPCQFPIELVERCVLAFTDKNDIVFDPYAGVGSSLIAAIKNGRRAYGVDQSEVYVNIGIERISSFLEGNLKIRPIGKPIYAPPGKNEDSSAKPIDQIMNHKIMVESNSIVTASVVTYTLPKGGEEMAQRGRKPKPTALKVLEGNPGKRPLPASEPQPAKKAPERPEWLEPEAKAEWDRLAGQLEHLGLLTEADMAAFAGYCQSYARWKAAEEFVSKHGASVKTPSGYWQQVPQVSIAQQYLKAMNRFCEQFGLSPASRARLAPDTGTASPDDPMEQLLMLDGGHS